jgi:hypothetical protein
VVAASQTAWDITWDILPEDFVFPDDPVDNINQPPLAAALTESLELAGYLPLKPRIGAMYQHRLMAALVE